MESFKNFVLNSTLFSDSAMINSIDGNASPGRVSGSSMNAAQ